MNSEFIPLSYSRRDISIMERHANNPYGFKLNKCLNYDIYTNKFLVIFGWYENEQYPICLIEYGSRILKVIPCAPEIPYQQFEIEKMKLDTYFVSFRIGSQFIEIIHPDTENKLSNENFQGWIRGDERMVRCIFQKWDKILTSSLSEKLTELIQRVDRTEDKMEIVLHKLDNKLI